LPINIRENLKRFFINDVIMTCPHLESGKTRKNCLLILDDTTTKILDRFMGVIDLIEGGIIGIEKLKCKRKKYSQFHAIYFIEPTEESIQLVINDFVPKVDMKEGESSNTPLYDFIHLIFCSKISEKNIQRLGNVKDLVYALISIREVNMNLLTIDENLFSLNFKLEKEVIRNKLSNREEEVVMDLSNQALSIWTVLKNVENIRLIYQRGGCAEKFAHEFRKKTQKMINKIHSKKIIKTNSPVFFFVLNRGSDLLSPLLQDLSYCGMYFNGLKKQEHVLEYEIENEKQEKIKQTSKLNENDTIWQKYKYVGCNTAAVEIQEAFKNFIQQNTNKGEDEDVLEKVQNLPQLQEFVKDFSKHLSNNKNIFDNSRTDFKEIFAYEQGIVTRKK
jgi:syntaxin-binding protein 1